MQLRAALVAVQALGGHAAARIIDLVKTRFGATREEQAAELLALEEKLQELLKLQPAVHGQAGLQEHHASGTASSASMPPSSAPASMARSGVVASAAASCRRPMPGGMAGPQRRACLAVCALRRPAAGLQPARPQRRHALPGVKPSCGSAFKF